MKLRAVTPIGHGPTEAYKINTIIKVCQNHSKEAAHVSVGQDYIERNLVSKLKICHPF